MARLVALSDVAARARYLADQRNSSYTNPTEMLALINDLYPEYYDELVAAYGENYMTAEDTITIVPGTSSYAMPDDFYKLIGIDFQVGNGTYVTVRPYMENERNRSLTTNTSLPAGTIRIRYVPAPPVFTSLDEEIDGIAGWERLLVLSLAIDMMDSEESDTSALARKYNRTLERIREMSQNRDESMPSRVTDIYSSNLINTYGALMYRMYGDNIEFLSTEFLGAATYPAGL